MPTDTSAAAPYEGRVDTHRFDIGIARALIEDASRVDSLPLLTCRFRPDGKVSRCVVAVSPALSLSVFLR